MRLFGYLAVRGLRSASYVSARLRWCRGVTSHHAQNTASLDGHALRLGHERHHR